MCQDATSGMPSQCGESVTRFLSFRPPAIRNRVIYQCNHPRNNRDVGYVKYVPGQTECLQPKEIGHGAIDDSVGHVAQGAADDQSQTRGRERGRGAGEPDPEGDRCRDTQDDEHKLTEIAALGKQAITHTLVPNQDKTEKRRNVDRLCRRNIHEAQHPPFEQLIGKEGKAGERQADRRQSAPKQRPGGLGGLGTSFHQRTGFLKPARRSHSRTASASRGVMSGNSGSAPTSGVIFQERAHFLPWASALTTATPLTSSRRKA